MEVINMTAKEASKELAEMSARITPKEADIIKKMGENELTPEIKEICYQCKNQHGTYYWQRILKNNIVIKEHINISLGEVCRLMNRWMRANKI